MIIVTVLSRRLLDIDNTESFQAFWGKETDREKPGAWEGMGDYIEQSYSSSLKQAIYALMFEASQHAKCSELKFMLLNEVTSLLLCKPILLFMFSLMC